MLDDILEKVKLISILNNYYIEFGVLQEDEYINIDVNILNIDDTISKVNMTVKDIVYITEYGTVTLPGKHILTKLLYLIDIRINKILNEIVDGVFDDDWTENYIESKLEELETHLQIYIRSIIRSELVTSSVNAMLGIKDENTYYYNFDVLERFIKCKIVKK